MPLATQHLAISQGDTAANSAIKGAARLAITSCTPLGAATRCADTTSGFRESSQVLVAEHPEGCSMFDLILGLTARTYFAGALDVIWRVV